jgi:hypothetical protein
MAASETIVFAVEVDASQATRTLEEVRLEFQRLQKELDKLTPGTEAFGKTLNELGKTKKVLADVATETRKATDAATEYTIENAKTVGQLKQVQKALLAQIQDVEKGSEAYEKLAADLKFANVQLSNFRKDTAAGPFLRDQFAEQTNAIKAFRAEVSKGFGDIGGSISKVGASLGSFLVAQVAIDAIVGIGKAALETVKEVEVLRNQLNLLFTETGAAQDALLVEAQTISKTFGVDAQEAIRAANVLQEQFGITAADSFKLLRDGFVSGANAGGDFLSTVTEYSTQLKAAGVDADNFVALISKTQTEGVFSDKGIDVVKEFGLRIREQTTGTKDALNAAFGPEFTNRILEGVRTGAITTEEALRAVSGQLRDTETTADKAQTVIADVFGGAGEDAGRAFIETLADADLNLGKLVANAEKAQPRLTRLEEANRALATAQVELSTALGGGATAFEAVGIEAQALGTRFLVAVIDALKEAAKPFIDLKNAFVELGDALGLTGGKIDFVGAIIETLSTTLKVSLLPIQAVISVGTALFRMWTAVGEVVSELVPGMGTLSVAFNGVKTAAQATLDFITTIPERISAVGKAVAEFIRAVGEGEFSEAGERAGKAYETSLTEALKDPAAAQAAAEQAAELKKQADALQKELSEKQKQAAKDAGLLRLASLEATKTILQAEGAERLKLLEVDTMIAKERLRQIEGNTAAEIAERRKAVAEIRALEIEGDKIRLQQIKDGQKEVAALYEQVQAAQLALQTEGTDKQIALLQAARDREIAALNQRLADSKAIGEQRVQLEQATAQRIVQVQTQFAQQEQAVKDAALKTELDAQKQAEAELQTLLLGRLDTQRQLAKMAADAAPKTTDAQIAAIDTVLDAEIEYANASIENEELRVATIEGLRKDAAESQEKIQKEQQEKEVAAVQQGLEVLAQAAELIGGLVTDAAKKREEEATREVELEAKKLEEIKAAEDQAEGAEKQRLTRLRKNSEANLAAKQKAEEKAIKDREAAEKRAAIAQKAIAITQAIINTALAVSAALATIPFLPLGPIAAGIAAATGAISIATIAAQQFAKGGLLPSFADGGVMSGPRHSAGGINLVHGQSGRVMGQIEGGEPVLTRGVASNPLLLSMAGLLNQMGGGVNFAAGGVSPSIMATGGVVTSAQLLEPANDMTIEFSALRAEIVALQGRPIYTNVTEVTDSQARQVQLVENRTL